MSKFLSYQFDTFLESSNPYAKIVKEFCDLADTKGWDFVLFGGSARSIYFDGAEANPSDLDMVVRGASLKELRAIYPMSEKTGFGGLRAKVYLADPNVPYSVDVWPIEKTYGFTKEPKQDHYTWDDLLRTCCFNVESIALSPLSYSIYENGFFDCMNSKQLELVSPYIASNTLVLIRAALFARRYGLTFGPKLTQFITEKGDEKPLGKVMQLQRLFFGQVKVACKDFSDMMGASYEGYPGCTEPGYAYCDAKSGVSTGV